MEHRPGNRTRQYQQSLAAPQRRRQRRGDLTADENTAEDVPAIVTTVNNVAAGNYDVFAFFWGNSNENWQIRTGLSSSDLLTFEKLSAQHVTLADISGTGTVSTAGAEVMYETISGPHVAQQRRADSGVRR